MFYLIATILLNTVLFALFKVFPKYKVDNLQAIVANYCTCVITGSISIGGFPVDSVSISQDWFVWALVMGVIFISIFNLIAYSTLKNGITTTTVANKLSMAIPVIFSIFLYGETLGIYKILGILIAFPAVYLTTRAKDESGKQAHIWLTALLFIGSGLLDTMVKYVEHHYLNGDEETNIYVVHVFLVAALAGIVITAIQVLRGKTVLQWRNIIAGIVLGVPNYFSIYFLVKLLKSGFLPSSAAIPVNNIGIVITCAVAGIVLFKEKASASRIIGLILSIAAIVLIAFREWNGAGL